MMNNYNHALKKMIVEMYEGSEPAAKLSEEYNMSRPTIYSWIKQFKPFK